MSDTAQGPDWWQASDGKWYPPQQQPGYAPPPPNMPPAAPGKPSKPLYKRVWFWIIIVVVLGMGGCIAAVAGTSKAISDANNVKHTIVFSVQGTGTPTITFSSFDNANNGTTQISDATLPWTKSFTGKGIFNDYSVTATLGSDGGIITCTVTIDGKVKSTNHATGAFASADCNGTSG